MFSDKSLVKMEDLHQELQRVAPSSEEERKILGQARERRDKKTDEISVTRAADLLAAAPDARQVIAKGPAQQAAHIAIEQVTGEHRIPVIVPEHPETLH